VKIAIRWAVGLALVAVVGCDGFSSNKETVETAQTAFGPAVPPPITERNPRMSSSIFRPQKKRGLSQTA
jgi:hypothetical protein